MNDLNIQKYSNLIFPQNQIYRQIDGYKIE